MLSLRAITIILLFHLLALTSGAEASGPGTVGAGQVAAQDALPEEKAAELLRTELARRYPGARIELLRPIAWTQRNALDQVESVFIQEENARGELRFTARGANEDGTAGTVTGSTTFAAWLSARIAVKRILPGDRLSPELFALQESNIAAGQAHEFRGVILPASANVNSLESRQTVLEGQLLLSTAVQKIPDVRRGDSVRVNLVSGELTLSTTGTAQESAYLDGHVRVMASKTKRELSGRLLAGGLVEVKL